MKKFMGTIVWGLLLMLLMSNTESQRGKIFPYEYKTETLPNGLKVILIPVQSGGTLAYYSIVRTGSRDEWEPGHSGFAHFFEHMMFRGTKKYPGNVYDRIITSIGANANAYTTDDYTCYHLNITKENLEKVMELESDRFQNLAYEKGEFQTESQAVYGEYRKGKTEPYFWIWEKMKDVAFDKHTYKHTTIGFEKDVKAMPEMYDYSLSFFRRYYRPENVILLIVGDIQPSNVMELVKKYYGGWQKGYEQPNIQPEPEQKKERTASVKYPGKCLPILGIGFKGSAFKPTDKSTIAAFMLGELAFGENSPLYKKLYLKEQKVQAIEPEFSKNRDPFLWLIWANVKEEKDLQYVRDEVLAAVGKFKSNPADEKELANLKKRMKYSFLMNLDNPEKIAGGLARKLAITGEMEAVNLLFTTLEGITPRDISDAAGKYFVPEKRTIVTLTGSK